MMKNMKKINLHNKGYDCKEKFDMRTAAKNMYTNKKLQEKKEKKKERKKNITLCQKEIVNPDNLLPEVSLNPIPITQ